MSLSEEQACLDTNVYVYLYSFYTNPVCIFALKFPCLVTKEGSVSNLIVMNNENEAFTRFNIFYTITNKTVYDLNVAVA